MSKVLILGFQGTLGRALVKEFASMGNYEVTAWDRGDLDITDKTLLREKINLLKPEIIINAAAYNEVDKIEADPAILEMAKKINGEAVGEIAKIAKDLGAIFVHYSSDHVFDGALGAGYTEDALPNPINKYGETKLLGEKLLQELGDKFFLIRLSKLFSGTPAVEGTKKSFVEKMLDLYNQGQREFNMVDEELSSPTSASDLVKFTRELIESGKPWGIYHGANSGECTWYEFAKEIFALKNYEVCLLPVSSLEYPRPALRPHKSILLNTKMPPQRIWQEALKEALSNL